MNEKLANFIVDLAVNPDRARRFAENPAAEAAAAGLSAADQAALLSRDTTTVRSALGDSYADHMTQVSQIKKGGKAKKGAKKTKGGAKKKSSAKKR